MKKINIIKKNQDYNRIINSIKPLKYNDFLFYVEENTNDYYKFGFSVGKKIGNAVTRNKIKRQVKSILDKIDFKNGFNCIIIVKKGILDKEFIRIQEDIFFAIKKLNLEKEKNNEKN